MSTRDIEAQIKELYDVEVSPTLISTVTDAVLEEVKAWQNRPLNSLYPIVYLDCIFVKLRNRDSWMVHNQAVFVAVGVNLEGYKEPILTSTLFSPRASLSLVGRFLEVFSGALPG